MRQAIEMGSGYGKSYVIIYVAAMLLYAKAVDSIIIVYSEAHIVASEAKNIEMLETLFGKDKVQVKTH